MKCVDIPAFLREDHEPKTRCERLSAALGGFQCENESVAPGISPGIIALDEPLVRYLLEDHIEEMPDGSKAVKPNAFSHAGTNGMSVDRRRHISNTHAAAEVARNYVGYVLATCANIRDIQAEGKRCFAVYDTALNINPAHADICQCVFAPKSQQAKYRRRLKDVFDRFPTPFEELSKSQEYLPTPPRSLCKVLVDRLKSLFRRRSAG